MPSHLQFFLFLHRLKTNSNVPSCGSQNNIHHIKSLFGEEIAIDTKQFVSLTSQLTFVNIRLHILRLVCLNATTNHDSK